MPQGKRTLAEQVEFDWMLGQVNVLYLSLRVLILLDLSYISRFWTQYEAWLSMQTASPEGLRPSTEAEKRFDIMTIMNGNSSLTESLKAMWKTRTPKEAYEVLAEKDVIVTNLKDKEKQLKRIQFFSDDVKEVLRMSSHAQMKAPVLKDRSLSDITVAVSTNGVCRV